tara:strand:+ start:336 stop:647 length:312 start_codon:yes stop_codon:yes gene_type:complete
MNKQIVELIEKRLEKGKKEYNQELNVHDGRDWLQEALEEQLDAIVYTAAKLIQIKDLNSKNDYKKEGLRHKLLLARDKAQEIEDYSSDIRALSVCLVDLIDNS